MTIVPQLQAAVDRPPRAAKPELRTLIAETLDIDLVEVTSSLSLHTIPEWSSLDHVSLLAAIEDRFGCSIQGPMVAELTSVAALERFLVDEIVIATDVDGLAPIEAGTAIAAATGAEGPGDLGQEAKPHIHRGLDGVYFDESLIAKIDGVAGRLTIRGYSIEDIARHSSFVETCHLVLVGTRPGQSEVAELTARMLEPEPLPSTIGDLVASMADHHPMAALRTALSLLNGKGPSPDRSAPAVIERGIVASMQASEILALHYRTRFGVALPPDETGTGTGTGTDTNTGAGAGADTDTARSISQPGTDPTAVSGRFLRQVFGRQSSPLESEAFDLVRRIQIEHGSNASTFAARVAAAAGADVGGSLIAALATFEGTLHGSAIEGVLDGLREIDSPDQAERYVADRRAGRKPIMGFGHRVYKTEDPRSAPLQAMANRLADQRGDRWAVDIGAALEVAMAPQRRHGLGMNVDTYAAIVYHLLGFPDDYLTALYAINRMVGWTAHIAEQIGHNVLIRPRLFYTGPENRSWEAGNSEGRSQR